MYRPAQTEIDIMKDGIAKVEAPSIDDPGLKGSSVARQWRTGRPTIGDKKMTPLEASKRHNKAFKDNGGRIMTIRLRNKEICEVLASLVKERGFKSETAAATWVLEESLRKYL